MIITLSLYSFVNFFPFHKIFHDLHNEKRKFLECEYGLELEELMSNSPSLCLLSPSASCDPPTFLACSSKKFPKKSLFFSIDHYMCACPIILKISFFFLPLFGHDSLFQTIPLFSVMFEDPHMFHFLWDMSNMCLCY